ncbi:hypothetical protein YC2023_081939 [Brassica napus]
MNLHICTEPSKSLSKFQKTIARMSIQDLIVKTWGKDEVSEKGGRQFRERDLRLTTTTVSIHQPPEIPFTHLPSSFSLVDLLDLQYPPSSSYVVTHIRLDNLQNIVVKITQKGL